MIQSTKTQILMHLKRADHSPAFWKRSAGAVRQCSSGGPTFIPPRSFNGNHAGIWPLNQVGRNRRIATAGRGRREGYPSIAGGPNNRAASPSYPHCSRR